MYGHGQDGHVISDSLFVAMLLGDLLGVVFVCLVLLWCCDKYFRACGTKFHEWVYMSRRRLARARERAPRRLSLPTLLGLKKSKSPATKTTPDLKSSIGIKTIASELEGAPASAPSPSNLSKKVSFDWHTVSPV